jgi:hypothetical protein
MRPGSLEKFANAALVAYVVLVPLLVCGGGYAGFAAGMGAFDGPEGRSAENPRWVRWLGSHPFAGDDRDMPPSGLAELMNTCVWALVPSAIVGAVFARLHNRRGSGPAA